MKSTTILTALAALFILFPFYADANAFDIKKGIEGRIVEATSNTVIEYATISLYSHKDSSLITGTISEENGTFVISKVKSGLYYIIINFIGFKEKTISDIVISKDNPIIELGDITMIPTTMIIEGLTVVAKKTSISSSIDKQVLNVKNNLSAQGGTAVDALKLSPSVSVNQDGNVLLRGNANITVLINGKPTSLKPDVVFKQISADIIDRIEVITSPSVKYNAEGTAGIINIILKKGANLGFNGLVNFTIGTKDKYAGNVGVNFNMKKVNISTGIEWRDFSKTADHHYYRDLYKKDTANYAYMGQDRVVRNSNLNYRFNIDYNPNENQSIAYSLNTGYQKNEVNVLSKTSDYSIPANQKKQSKNSFYLKQHPRFLTNNLNYTSQLSNNRILSLNTYYSFIDYYLYNDQTLSVADSNFNIIDDQPYLQKILNDNYSNDVKVDLDYTHPINEKLTLESGLSFQNYTRFLDVSYDEYNYEHLQWQANPEYTNKYDFVENIYGGYINVETEYFGIKTAAGLRVEYMDRELIQQTSNDGYFYDKINVFPGLSLSKSFSNQQSLKLSLTNRINRPDEYMMNPFKEFEDEYFSAQGNPNLVPELSRSLELSYRKIHDKFVLTSNLYYRRTVDKIEQKLTIGKDDKINTIFHNDANDEAIGLEIMGKFDIAKWWSVNASSNLYSYKIEGNIYQNPFSKATFSWNTQLINSLNFGKNSSLQIIGYYNSRTIRSQGDLSDFYFVDLAYRHELFNKKLSLNLQVKDIFRSANYELNTATENMTLLGDFNNESPIVQFSLSYQISQYKKLTKDVQTEFDM